MKNRTLALTAKSVPYIKELRAITKSVTGSILMQQLDYWFAKKPQGFFKYVSPLMKINADGKEVHDERDGYKKGDSWTEELGFSEFEFGTAFSKIGVRHSSKANFLKALGENKAFINEDGQQLYYCSYHDRKTGLMWFYRNHAWTDAAIDAVFQGYWALDLQETNNLHLSNQMILISVNKESSVTETKDLQLLSYTEITSEITTEITSENKDLSSDTSDTVGKIILGVDLDLKKTGDQQPSEATKTPTPSETPPPKPKKRRVKTVPVYDPEGFERFFYHEYPKARRVERPEAVEAWDEVQPTPEEQAKITADLARRCKTDPRWIAASKGNKEAASYLKHPSRYLKKQSWEGGDDGNDVDNAGASNAVVPTDSGRQVRYMSQQEKNSENLRIAKERYEQKRLAAMQQQNQQGAI